MPGKKRKQLAQQGLSTPLPAPPAYVYDGRPLGTILAEEFCHNFKLLDGPPSLEAASKSKLVACSTGAEQVPSPAIEEAGPLEQLELTEPEPEPRLPLGSLLAQVRSGQPLQLSKRPMGARLAEEFRKNFDELHGEQTLEAVGEESATQCLEQLVHVSKCKEDTTAIIVDESDEEEMGGAIAASLPPVETVASGVGGSEEDDELGWPFECMGGSTENHRPSSLEDADMLESLQGEDRSAPRYAVKQRRCAA